MGLRLPKTRGMLRREAAGWLVRLQSGREPDVEAKFQRWYRADPAHAAAFERVRRSYDQAGLLRNLDPPELQASQAPGAAGRSPRYAMAAAVAAILLVPATVLMIGRGAVPFGRPTVLMLATHVGEIREVRLSDGSTVTLDTASAIEVDFSRAHRRARLRKGRIRLAVATGGEPFVIEAGLATVTTSDGTVDVGEQGRVDVLRGDADVRQADGGTVSLTAGQAIAGGATKVEKEPSGAAPDWTHRMLQFDSTPLPSAIAIANRYSLHRIVLGTGLEQVRVTGAFKAGDAVGLAKALAAAFHLTLRQNPDGDLILSRDGATG